MTSPIAEDTRGFTYASPVLCIANDIGAEFYPVSKLHTLIVNALIINNFTLDRIDDPINVHRLLQS